MFYVPTYRRHPNGQAFCQWRGKRYYLGKHGTEESVRRFKQFMARVETNAIAAPPALPPLSRDRTIVELIVHYRAFAQTYYAKDGKTTKEFASMMDALARLDLKFGDLPADQFGPVALEELQQFMVEQKLSRGVVNHHINRVKRFFRWCCRKQHVPQSLYHGLLCVPGLQRGRTDAREAPGVKPIHRHWVDATLPWLNPTIAAMVQMQLLCGMRPAEVCRMRGRDLNMGGEIWLYTPVEHKNAWRDLPRIIAIPKRAQEILKPFLRTDINAYLFSPAESEAIRNQNRRGVSKPDRKTPIYPSELRAREKARRARQGRASKRPKRDHYDTGSYRRAVTYAITKANRELGKLDPDATVIPHWHPSQLRHTISTEISQAIGEQAAQRWLGHERLETTGIYTEKQVSELVNIARRLDQQWTQQAS